METRQTNRTDELVQVLDAQIDHLRQKADSLRKMVDCMRRNDAAGLEELLLQQAELGAEDACLRRELDELRGSMGADLGLPPGDVTLGRLVEVLDGPESLELSDRRERLVTAVEQVRSASTALCRLVEQAMDFNERLLEALTGALGAGATYSAGGVADNGASPTTFRQTV